MRRILVIDDEPFVLEALKRVLATTATAVIGTSTADAGLAAMRESPIDLVIIDVVLAGNGWRGRDQDHSPIYPAVRIIAMSGGGKFGLDSYLPDAISTNAYLAACKAAGADGILAKPFETGELRSLIEQVQAA